MYRTKSFVLTKFLKSFIPKNIRLISNTSISIETGNDPFSFTKNGLKPQTSQNIKSNPRKILAWEDAIPYKQMPGPKPLPIIGNTWRFTHGEFKGLDPVDLYKKLNDSYGSICRLSNIIGMPNLVILFDPEHVREVYVNEGPWPERKILKCITHYRKVVRKELFGEIAGLPVAQGEEWFKTRTQANPIFMQPRIAEEFIPKVEFAARQFTNRISLLVSRNSEMPEDFMTEINKYTLEAVSYITFNKRLGLLEDNVTEETKKIAAATTRVFELCFELDMQPSIWSVIPTPKWKEFVRNMDFLTEVYMKIIDEEIKQQTEGKLINLDENKSILQKFLEIDKTLAIAMVFDTLAAGVDTTSNTLAVLLYLLAKHKRVQAKLRKELIEVFPRDKNITPEQLNQCKYLKAVIKESSRVHGASVSQLRTAPKDFVIGDYQIPKGVNLVGAQCIMVKSEKFVKRAKEYIPERFMREYADYDFSMHKVPKHIYLPFGFGPRSCIGKRLANLELEISLAMILRKFRLDWKQPNMRFKTSIIYGPADPLKLDIYPLEDNYKEEIKDLDTLNYCPECTPVNHDGVVNDASSYRRTQLMSTPQHVTLLCHRGHCFKNK